MEGVRIRDNSSPHPTENSAPSLTQTDPLLPTPSGGESDAESPAQSALPPSTTNFQHDDKPPPRPKPLFRGFERPSFSRIAILTILCLITYPAFYVLTLVAKDKSLFVVRVIVSVWCSGVGFALGYILLQTAAQHLEATSEFTLVGYRDFLTPYFSNSLGHCDSHEPRRRRNETPRLGQRLEYSNKRYACPPCLPVSFQESRYC